MAGYKTHFIGSVIIGAGAASFIYLTHRLDLLQSSIVMVLGGLSGFIPDLDSDTGKPINVLMHLLSVLIPIVLFHQAGQYIGTNRLNILLYFAVSYFFLHYIVFFLIKKITVHRGIMHSIPFCLLCSGIVFLILSGYGQPFAIYGAIVSFLGAFSHLVLDELNAVKFKYGFIPVPKASIGSAVKFKSDSIGATLAVYSLLVLTCYFIFRGSR